MLIGIRNVKIYAREIVSASGNEIEFSAPNWDQRFETGVQTGRNGEDGNHGENGPQSKCIVLLVSIPKYQYISAGSSHIICNKT